MSTDEPQAPKARWGWFKKLALGMTILIGLCGGVFISSLRCWSALLQWGIDVRSCPVGTPVANVEVSARDLGRAVDGAIEVSAYAVYTTARADTSWTTALDVHRANATIVQSDGTRTALVEDDAGWVHAASRQTLRARLPSDLPDGDHILEVEAQTRLGDQTLALKLPVFAPAVVHVLTDRPLYEPGHTVAMRSVVLRARDLVPLAGRPGSFTVHDPMHRVVFEEPVAASEWGVASVTLPLAPDAELGMWKACWQSRGAEECTPFLVTEFTLPRFTVEASSRTAWSGRGDSPIVDGRVALASGAPIAGADITIDWSVDGAWTLPHAWEKALLPRHARTDVAGRFALTLPPIPEDLVGTATLVGSISAVDPSGDRQTTRVDVLLSVDDLSVSAVTELGDTGVVEGMNNRVWLRATTPSGAPMPGATLTLQRAWDPTAPALTAATDEDGVAVFQLDPGPPVNVVVPQPPMRPPPPPEPVVFSSVTSATGEGSVSLADQRALQNLRSRLDACRAYVGATQASGQVVLTVQGGRIAAAHAARGQPSPCLASRLNGQPMPTGDARAVELRVLLQPLATPSLTASSVGWLHFDAPDFGDTLAEAMAAGRACLSPTARSAALSPPFAWSVAAGSTRVSTQPLGPQPSTGPALPCLQRALSGLRLSSPATADAAGHITLSTVAPPAQQSGSSIPQERVELGYELAVTATGRGGEALGSTTVVLTPGTVPDIRLRADPTLPEAGGTVTVAVLRGPDFVGTLPDKLFLHHASGSALEASLDKDDRTATFTLPDDQTGWFTAKWNDALARVYVAPSGSLTVDVSVHEDVLRPGEEAQISVRTTGASGPTTAAVSLFGVDETLSVLAPLPGPKAMAGMQAQVPTPRPAFGSLDGVALVRGDLRGANARAATVLRVGEPPVPAAVDQPVTSHGSTEISPRTVAVDRFFPILAELARVERAWEASAPADEKLTPERAAELWKTALAQAESSGLPITDIYGVPLHLTRLPSDLLQMVSPQAIVTDGARLPDDLENWDLWVVMEASQ